MKTPDGDTYVDLRQWPLRIRQEADHGTRLKYKRDRCRCGDCVTAEREYQWVRRMERRRTTTEDR